MNRRAMSVGGVGMTMLLGILGACSDDSTSENSANDAGASGETSSIVDGSLPSSPGLPAYVVPGTESMAAIAINPSTGEFFVDSAESGKIYRGMAGAEQETQLELFADVSSAGVSRGGHITLSPDGKTLFMLSALGEQPNVKIIDVASKAVTKTVAMPFTGGGPFSAVQDVAVSPDGNTIYASNSFENVIHTVDRTTDQASTFPISSEFPHIADTSQGFINATGLTVSNDGKYLLVVHIIDKHLYRISLDPGTLGKAQQIDTAPYNISGNGVWLGADNDVIEVAGDELRVFRFKMNADYTKGDYRAKYQGDFFEQGLTYAVAHEDRLLVLNGSGVTFANAGGGGFPGGGIPEGGPPPGDGGGFPLPSGDAGAKKLPMRVLQLRK